MKNKFTYLREQCKVCKGKGFLFSPEREWKDGQVEKDAVQCECLKKMMLYTNLDAANIPREYYDLTLDSFKETDEEKAIIKKKIHGITQDIHRFVNEGHNLLMYGPNGTGKTMLSIEILKAAVKNKFTVHYEFFPIICEAFSKKGYKADEVKEYYDKLFSTVDILVLDELGKESEMAEIDKDSARRLLEIHVLKKRGGKPVILLANLYDSINNRPWEKPEVKNEIKTRYGLSVLSIMSSKNWHFTNVFDDDFRNKVGQ
jgi:DNA replication protein DnaC